MAIFISLALFVLLMGVITVYGYRRYSKPARVYEQLGAQSVPQPTEITLDRITPDGPSVWVNMMEQLGQKVPYSAEDASSIRLELMAAGHREEKAVAVFIGIRIVSFAVLLIMGFFLRDFITSNSILRIVIVIGFGVLGYFGPTIVLERMVDHRREELRFALPDGLDLMVVCVEAGLGLDQAIQYVGRELAITHKALSGELELVHLEMRAGKRRSDALRNLGARTGEPELRKLVATLIQTDRFGTSMADALRTHSEFMRVRRRQDAQERAGKVGVKLVFPIFFFILPSMMLVSAGPAMLHLFKQLFPMMGHYKGGV